QGLSLRFVWAATAKRCLRAEPIPDGRLLGVRRRGMIRVRKPIIGLSGGIGAGKSEAARLLSEMGADVIDSDAISRRALDSEEVIGLRGTWWGPAVVTADGRADRRRIADIVFADEAQRQRLEVLLHPRVAAERNRRIEAAERDPGVRAIVIDSPLLYEA